MRFPQTIAHPWHGVSIGEQSPDIVNCFIEIVPTDTVKYEVDKASGLLRLDRPQKFSNLCPSLYGFIPQTYCGGQVGKAAAVITGNSQIKGDGDPMDICVLTERPINQNGILIAAIPIGGFRMIDGDEADDKIIAVLKDDPAFGELSDITEAPQAMIERLRHYFLTYKQMPGEKDKKVAIVETYNALTAKEMIKLSQQDYAHLLASG